MENPIRGNLVEAARQRGSRVAIVRGHRDSEQIADLADEVLLEPVLCQEFRDLLGIQQPSRPGPNVGDEHSPVLVAESQDPINETLLRRTIEKWGRPVEVLSKHDLLAGRVRERSVPVAFVDVSSASTEELVAYGALHDSSRALTKLVAAGVDPRSTQHECLRAMGFTKSIRKPIHPEEARLTLDELLEHSLS